MDLLQGQLTDGLVDQLSKQLGGADKQQTAKAANGVFSTLMGALSRNAATPEGASSLANALDNDHDGSLLENMMDMLGGGGAAPANPRAANGTGILKHVLGGKQDGAASMISKMSGLSSGQTGNLMSMLAPMVMGALGGAKKKQGMDISDLTSFLTGSVSNASEKNPEMGLVGRFLDRDGDGSFMDDIAGMGMNLLGKFMKK